MPLRSSLLILGSKVKASNQVDLSEDLVNQIVLVIDFLCELNNSLRRRVDLAPRMFASNPDCLEHFS
ncbi:Hypothetical predicted protein [Prunus dulcis]|uniref:Uncharacterized protein n=1 Tax=Prunus dulcis TaxID=3755 RepID=A0A5E4G4J4_PRUDU|nr:Hypothetical predicted protein [Prunus dulcis]